MASMMASSEMTSGFLATYAPRKTTLAPLGLLTLSAISLQGT